MGRKLSALFLVFLFALSVGGSASAASGAAPLIAPPSACPGQARAEAPASAQETAMLCMVNYARAQAGLGQLGRAESLDLSSGDKAEDVLRCDSFSHFACGRDFTYWLRQTGYIAAGCWRVGENLAWGAGPYGTVRSIFRAWMRSPGHRENILGDFAETGIALRVGALSGRPDTSLWAEHFGVHC